MPDQRREMEEELFQVSHDVVGTMLAKQWHLPDSYILAIEQHHHPELMKGSSQNSQVVKYPVLPGIMKLCDLCNAVFTCHDKPKALKAFTLATDRLFGLTEEKVSSFLNLLPDQVKETAGALSITLGSQADFDRILEQANHRIIEDNISYHELTWRLQKALKQRDEYAAMLEAELTVAREIQKSLQPDKNTVQDIGAFNTPAMQLSGDFYDYFERQDGTICFCLGDVSGKGTSAALLMAKSISLFRCLCKVENDISKVIRLMNNEICETAVRGMFVTFVAGLLDPVSKGASIINAGHLPPFLVNNKNIVKIDPANPPLGIVPEVTHPVVECSLKQSRLYLYSDGFTEGLLKQSNGQGDRPLGLKGFLKWLIKSKTLPVKKQLSWIQSKCGTNLEPQSDDLTMMIISGE